MKTKLLRSITCAALVLAGSLLTAQAMNFDVENSAIGGGFSPVAEVMEETPAVVFENFENYSVGPIDVTTQFKGFHLSSVDGNKATSAEIKEDADGNKYLEAKIPGAGGFTFNQATDKTNGVYMNARFDAQGEKGDDSTAAFGQLYSYSLTQSLWANRATDIAVKGQTTGTATVTGGPWGITTSWGTVTLASTAPKSEMGVRANQYAGTVRLDNIYYYELPEGKTEEDYTVTFTYDNLNGQTQATETASFMTAHDLPVLEGEEFLGWSEVMGGKILDSSIIAYENKTLYAVWGQPVAPTVIFEDFEDYSVGPIDVTTQFKGFHLSSVDGNKATSAEIKEDADGNKYLEAKIPGAGGFTFNQATDKTNGVYMNARFDAQGEKGDDSTAAFGQLYSYSLTQSLWANRATDIAVKGQTTGTATVTGGPWGITTSWGTVTLASTAPKSEMGVRANQYAGTVRLDNVYYYELLPNATVSDYTVTFTYNNLNGLTQEAEQVTFMSDYTLPVLSNVGTQMFAGWADENGNLVGTSAVAYKDMTLTAVWKDMTASENFAHCAYQIREESPVGLRFAFLINCNVASTATDYGFVVTRKTLLGDNELTLGMTDIPTLTGYAKQAGGREIVYETETNTELGVVAGVNKAITAVITGIPEGSESDDYVVRPFFVIGGNNYYGNAVTQNYAAVAAANAQ